MTKRQAIEAGAGATRPWRSPDASPGSSYYKGENGADSRMGFKRRDDEPEKIQMCLNCKWPRCINCLK